MRIQWKRIRTGGFDPERRFGSLFAGLLAVGTVWLSLVGPPTVQCTFRTLTGRPCPTCGATRACQALLQGDVAGAFRFNPLFTVALTIGSVWLVYAAVVVAWRLPRLRIEIKTWEAVLLGSLFMGAVVVNWCFLLYDGR